MPKEQRTRKRRRPLNLVLIKSTIVMIAAALNGLLCGFSGVSASVTLEPQLIWMLGMDRVAAAVTALVAGGLAAAVAVLELMGRHTAAPGFLRHGVLVTLGAAVGAAIAVAAQGRQLRAPRSRAAQRFCQTIPIVLAIYVSSEALHQSQFHYESSQFWIQSGPLFLVGAAAGMAASWLRVSSSVLFVPLLLLGPALGGREAVAISLFVTAVGALIPALQILLLRAYHPIYGAWAFTGAILGGAVAGVVWTHVPERNMLLLFALSSMILAGRSIAAVMFDTPSRPGASPPGNDLAQEADPATRRASPTTASSPPVNDLTHVADPPSDERTSTKERSEGA